MYADGKNISAIAAKVQASRTTVKKAIRNGYVEKDDIAQDHKYIDRALDKDHVGSTAPRQNGTSTDGWKHQVSYWQALTNFKGAASFS
jgi:hypothetical protein